MRKQLLVFIPLLLMVMVAAAETQSNGTEAPKRSALVKVQAVPSNEGLNLEFTTRGDVMPKVSELESPARIVVDLPNTLALTAKHIIVENTGVKRIRIGMDGQAQPTTRLVIDLEKPCTYELAGSGNNRVLKLHMVNVRSKEVESATAPATTAAVAAPEAPKQEASINPATAFAFIEPSYKVKDESAVEPPARAVNAAAKFVERPAGDLLPHPSASMQPQAAVNLAAEQKTQLSQPATVGGPKYTGEPISVNLKDVDLKDFFRLIHEISGLNVVLDPNVKGSLTIVLDDVPWDQALDIVLKNNDLARQLDGNVLRIATVDTLRKEAESHRAQQEAEALAVEKVTITRFLSYAHSKDVVPTIKQFLSQRGDVISDDRTNALIIQDIPSAIPSIDRLLTQLDRKTQEVEIEARVVAATRSFAREIGTQLGFGWGNGPTAVGGASSVGSSPISTFGGTPQWMFVGDTVPTATTGAKIPLFSNLGVTQPNSGISLLNVSNNVRLDAILTLAESRGLLKILSRPRVVTQNNIQALVKQGVRVPIVTQAQLGGPPTVTYVDAFLRLTVVPQITSEGTIFLNVDVENTSPDFGHAVQGNPTLITQQATTQVLVTDGGTVVVGGVIQTQNSVSIDQVPLLGSIPYLGNLFKHRAVSTSNSELIFFITPRIIQT
jgi:type IV pilus assembly protein PilQ